MSGRPTADIVADLRLFSINTILEQAGSPALKQFVRDAADRLAELDHELRRQQDLRLDNLRPPCPTCGGRTTVDPGVRRGGAPVMNPLACPDCIDGKVSIEQLAATWRAVWDDGPITLHPRGPEPHHWISAMAAHLRQAKP